MQRFFSYSKYFLIILLQGALFVRCGNFNAAGGLLALAMENNPDVVLPVIYDVYMANSMSSTFIEDESSGAYTLVLASQPEDTVTVSIAFNTTQLTLNGSGTSPLDVVFSTGDWNTIRTISVVPVSNTTPESYQSLTLIHTVASTDTNYNGLTPPDITLNLVDNDNVKRIFTATDGSSIEIQSGGSLGGISGADTLCNTSPTKPTGSTYRALLVDGVNRVACTTSNCSGGASEHTDWVFSPYTIYTRSDGTTRLFIANANGIYTGLTNSLTGVAAEYWTGLNTDWTTNGSGLCSSWTSSSASEKGNEGLGSNTGMASIYTAQDPCHKIYRIYCVEQ